MTNFLWFILSLVNVVVTYTTFVVMCTQNYLNHTDNTLTWAVVSGGVFVVSCGFTFIRFDKYVMEEDTVNHEARE